MARPTKLNGPVRAKLLEAIEAGSTLKDAAAYAGIGKSTLDRYRQQDEALAAAVEQAEGTAAVTYLRAIHRALDRGDWKAAAWWLERRRPEEWGRPVVEREEKPSAEPLNREDRTHEELDVGEPVLRPGSAEKSRATNGAGVH